MHAQEEDGGGHGRPGRELGVVAHADVMSSPMTVAADFLEQTLMLCGQVLDWFSKVAPSVSLGCWTATNTDRWSALRTFDRHPEQLPQRMWQVILLRQPWGPTANSGRSRGATLELLARDGVVRVRLDRQGDAEALRR